MTNPDCDPPLDPETIAALKELGGEDDPELFGDLVAMFLGDTPSRLQSMEEALSAGDGDALGRVAHALKSSCGNLGAHGLAQLCGEIEALGRSGGVDQARSLVSDSKSHYEVVREALQSELN